MKSIKQLMQELGWEDKPNKKVAEAFLKNLIQAENESKRPLPLKSPPLKSENVLSKKTNFKNSEEQLTFDLFQASGEK